MSKKFKTILMALLVLLIILQVVPDFIPDISEAASTVTDNASNPAVLRTVFNFWWIPVGMLVIEVLFPGTAQRAVRAIRSRRRK